MGTFGSGRGKSSGEADRVPLTLQLESKLCLGAEPNVPARCLVRGGIAPMWKSVLDEAREVVWLASVVGWLSALGVGIAIALAAS